MADFRYDVPKIVWGDALGNTIIFPGPPDFPKDFPIRQEGSELTQFPSGVVDAWSTGRLYVVQFEVRHIPLTDTNTFGYTATGWQEADGWAAFLDWAWDAGEFDLYPDKDAATSKTCILRRPERGEYDHEGTTGLKRLAPFVAQSADGTAFNWY